MPESIGIDLGTTRSVVAHVQQDEPEVIENADGKPITPSVVHITDSGEIQVGENAVDRLQIKPDRTVDHIKNEMGSTNDIQIGEEKYSPQKLSSHIIEKLVTDASDRIGTDVSNAVITVPAYFTDRERTATREAGEMIGLNVDNLLAEPSAAVLAYGLKQKRLDDEDEETIFVYDLGGGTFDATLVEANYAGNIIETIATDGDNDLGGADWTQAIVDWIYSRIESDTGIDLRDESNEGEIENIQELRSRVVETARDAKHRLSEQSEVTVTIPFAIPSEGYNFDETLSRDKFEELTNDLFEQTKTPIENIFNRTDYTTDDVEKILLIGGATRMPRVEELVEGHFGIEPSKEISPDKAVALGAAVQAAILDDEVTTVMPDIEEGDEDSTGGMVIIEALPQSIGVEVQPDNKFDPVVERDTSLPTTKRKEGYGVQYEGQTDVEINVYQGDNEKAEQNELLGEVTLSNIPPREPGDPSLAIEFTVDDDGTLEVRAEDMKSGKDIETEIESALEKDN